MIRRPLRQKVYWRIPRDCEGETIFIIAGGTSVADQDLSRLKGRRVMVINSSYETYPDAEILFFGDGRWWRLHKKHLASFAGKIITTAPDVGADQRLLFLRQRPAKTGLSAGLDEACIERTSLHAAIDIAAKRGPKRLVLLGADMQPGKDGRTHHHKPHPKEWTSNRRPKVDKYQRHMEHLKLTAEPLRKLGIEVLNCSPVSLITWWPKADFNELTKAD